MAEKKGSTEKLVYPFNDEGCCEVEFKPGVWVRVTSREFRSMNFPRRISYMKKDQYVTEMYDGPVYYFGSNKKVDLTETTKTGIHHLNDIDIRKVEDTRPFIGRL